LSVTSYSLLYIYGAVFARIFAEKPHIFGIFRRFRSVSKIERHFSLEVHNDTNFSYLYNNDSVTGREKLAND
jgi:hypothetical protein